MTVRNLPRMAPVVVGIVDFADFIVWKTLLWTEIGLFATFVCAGIGLYVFYRCQKTTRSRIKKRKAYVPIQDSALLDSLNEY